MHRTIIPNYNYNALAGRWDSLPFTEISILKHV